MRQGRCARAVRDGLRGKRSWRKRLHNRGAWSSVENSNPRCTTITPVCLVSADKLQGCASSFCSSTEVDRPLSAFGIKVGAYLKTGGVNTPYYSYRPQTRSILGFVSITGLL